MDNQSTKASFGSSVFNMMNGAVGSGILALPYACSFLGYGGFIITLVAAGCVSLFAVYLLLANCEYYNCYSYEKVCKNAIEKVWPKFDYLGARIAGFVIFFQIICSVATYGTILKTRIPELIQFVLEMNQICVDNDSWFFDGNILLAIIYLTVVLPLMFAKNLDFLKYSSAVGMISMFITALVILGHSFVYQCTDAIEGVEMLEQYANNQSSSSSNQCNTACCYQPDEKILKDWENFKAETKNADNQTCEIMFYQDEPRDPEIPSTMAFSAIFFSCILHDVVLSIYENLKDASKEKMMKVSYVTYAGFLSMYATVGLSGYFTWGKLVTSDVIIAYSSVASDSLIIFMARILITNTVLFSIPLVAFAGRKAFWSMVLDESLQKKTSGNNWQNFKHYGFAVIFLAFEYLMATKAETLGAIINFSGVTACLIYMILPSGAWICTFYDRKPGSAEMMMHDKEREAFQESEGQKGGDYSCRRKYTIHFILAVLMQILGIYFITDVLRQLYF